MCFKKIKVTDGALVADFTSAEPPLLWRMELSRVHAVAFRLMQSGRAWELGTESAKGEFVAIARFNDRKQAEKAMNAVSKALRSSRSGGHFIRSLALVLLGVVLTLTALGLDTLLNTPMTQTSTSQSEQPLTQLPSPPEGKPVAADQILQMPAAQ